jgi:predicted lipase
MKIIEGLNPFHERQRFGYITRLNRYVALIALCSTANVCDAFVNVDNSLVRFSSSSSSSKSNSKVHQGYLQRVEQNIWYDVVSFLYFCPEIQYLYITGHSMGGALAVVLGMKLAHEFPDRYVMDMYTFGSPKLCNRAFVDYYDSLRHVRIQTYHNTADKVVYKPTNPEYVHIGTVIRHTIDTGNVNVNHGIKAYRECLYKLPETTIPKRRSRLDEQLSASILELFG